MIKRFLIAIVLSGLICGGLVYFNFFRDQKIAEFFANMPRPAVTVSTIEVQPQVWKPGIEAIGTIVASRGVEIGSRAGGIVKEILFEPNDKVEQGQLLVQLDDELEQADLIAAKANVTRDQQALERAQTLSKRGVSSTSTLEAASAALDASRSLLERVEAQIRLKRITAPFSGTIGLRRVDIGEYLNVGSVVATLQDLSTMKVDFSVPEQQIRDVDLGQKVLVGLSSDELKYSGKISGIEPKIDPGSRLVSMQAEVANADHMLRPGQFAIVRIELPSEKNVIALPQTAVVPSLYGAYVYAVREDEAAEGDEPKLVARQVFVTPGRRYEGGIEIIDGLKAGDVVVTAGQNKLSSGAAVAVDNSVTPGTTPKAPGADS